MNVLITSAGRRTQLIRFFKKEFFEIGSIIATDSNPHSAAIYEADRHYIVPPIDSRSYIDVITDICVKEEISAIFSLIDPELSILAENKKSFEEIGVQLLSSSAEVCKLCFDKLAMHKFCLDNDIRSPKTYGSIRDFNGAYQSKEIEFPVLTKPRFGSGSIDVNIAHTINDLEYLFSKREDLIIQELLKGQEYGVDAYIDPLSGEIISVFIKAKIEMRSGETDKAVSVLDSDLSSRCRRILKEIGLKGPVDLDFYKANNEFYLLDVNPRFGGGYPLAYECGCNFPAYILTNLLGRPNLAAIGEYPPDMYMFKQDSYIIHKPPLNAGEASAFGKE